MAPEHLRQIIAGGETLAVEFKGEQREPLACRGERRGATYVLPSKVMDEVQK